MKTRWKLALGGVVVVASLYLVVNASYNAAMFEFSLSHWTPTESIDWSKRYKVFAGTVHVSPETVDLGDVRFRIVKAWIEHRTSPERTSRFKTHQRIHEDLVLSLRFANEDGKDWHEMWNQVELKDQRSAHILRMGVNNVFQTEVGIRCPGNVVFGSKSTGEATVALGKNG